MLGRGQQFSGSILAAWMALNLCGCPQVDGADAASGEASAVAVVPVSLEGRSLLEGGDQRAWLTSAGSLGDNNYCNAELEFPLKSTPDWEYKYTSAQFSLRAANSLLHYDGLVVVSANSSQLLGLDATSGAVVFNQDVYLHLDGNQVENLTTIFFHPRGLLTGMDNLGRIYCWDVTETGLDQRWLTESADGNRAMIATGQGVFTGWENMMRCLSIADGGELWSFPNLSGENGVVMSKDGLLVSWTPRGEFYCMDSVDGTLQWSIFTGTNGREWATRAIIDDDHDRVYFVLPDERAQCRDIASGELIWEHTWTDLLPWDERQKHFAEHNADPVPLWAVECSHSPAGLTLAMLHGNAINIDHDGHRTWTYDSDVLLLGELAFDNAILITEWYLGLDYQQINPGWRTFSPGPPTGWERFDAATELRQRQGTFQRFVWLDPVDGSVIQIVEPEYPVSALIPAGEKVIVGESYRSDVQFRRVLAYNWLAWEEN